MSYVNVLRAVLDCCNYLCLSHRWLFDDEDGIEWYCCPLFDESDDGLTS